MANTPIVNIASIPELRKRLLFTLALIAVYRLGVYVPTPGVDVEALRSFFGTKTVFDVFNLFSGGALERFSVFALGVMPYISASIITQLLTFVVPSLEKLNKEGEQGRKKISQYTRYLTVVLALIQAFGISMGLYKQGIILPGNEGSIFFLQTMITLAAGTTFVMWLGEQITERGIGNGISLIIFSGIVTRVPSALRDAWATKDQYGSLFGFLALLGFIFLIVALVIFFERSYRKIPIQHAKRPVGRKIMVAQGTHLPLKLNQAGVIPPIFASSLILFPATIAQFSENPWVKNISEYLGRGWLHTGLYVTLIIFFTFFYTAVTFRPDDMSENIRSRGGFIPGIRPGQETTSYLDKVVTRLTLVGALYIACVCILPELLINNLSIPSSLATTFGGTSLLIVVGVAMDTLAQIEAFLIGNNYQGLMNKGAGRFRGRGNA